MGDADRLLPRRGRISPADWTDPQAHTLADFLQSEIRRVRDEVLPAYVEIGAPGTIAAALMRQELDAAVKALAEHDAVACLRLYNSLKGYTT